MGSIGYTPAPRRDHRGETKRAFWLIIGAMLLMFLFGAAVRPASSQSLGRTYDGWSTQQKIGGTAAVLAITADMMTTIRARHLGYGEDNPLLGRQPSDAKVFAASAIAAMGTVWAANRWPKRRTLILWGVAIIETAVAIDNSSRR